MIKMRKFYLGNRLVVGVTGAAGFDDAKHKANDLFKTRASRLIASNAIIEGNDIFFDGAFTDTEANAIAVYKN